MGYPGQYGKLLGMRNEDVSTVAGPLCCINMPEQRLGLLLLAPSPQHVLLLPPICTRSGGTDGHRHPGVPGLPQERQGWGYPVLSPVCIPQCGPGGCLIELAQQLFIIMVGKQIVSNIQEFFIP